MTNNQPTSRDLVSYSAGTVAVPAADKKVAKQAKAVYDKTRLTGMKIQGRYAAAGVVAESIMSFHEHVLGLTNGDPFTQTLLIGLEVDLAQSAKRDVRGMFNDWSM